MKDILGAIKIGYYADGSPSLEEELEQAIVPEEDYSKLLAEELPSQSPLARAIIAWAFATAKHVEALPYAIDLLDDADGSTRFTAGLAAAALHDARGLAALRRQIAQPDPDMYQGHIIEGLEETLARSPNPELQEILNEAMTAFGFK